MEESPFSSSKLLCITVQHTTHGLNTSGAGLRIPTTKYIKEIEIEDAISFNTINGTTWRLEKFPSVKAELLLWLCGIIKIDTMLFALCHSETRKIAH